VCGGGGGFTPDPLLPPLAQAGPGKGVNPVGVGVEKKESLGPGREALAVSPGGQGPGGGPCRARLGD